MCRLKLRCSETEDRHWLGGHPQVEHAPEASESSLGYHSHSLVISVTSLMSSLSSHMGVSSCGTVISAWT